MSTVSRILAICSALTLFVGNSLSQERTIPPLFPELESDVPMEGTKAGYCYIWYTKQKDEWHVKTETDGGKHEFEVTLKVKGGTISRISEPMRISDRKVDDPHRHENDRNETWFRFATGNSPDEFSFRLDDAAERIMFDVTIDGKSDCGDRILVGEKRTPAVTNGFGFSTHGKGRR